MRSGILSSDILRRLLKCLWSSLLLQNLRLQCTQFTFCWWFIWLNRLAAEVNVWKQVGQVFGRHCWYRCLKYSRIFLKVFLHLRQFMIVHELSIINSWDYNGAPVYILLGDNRWPYKVLFYPYMVLVLCKMGYKRITKLHLFQSNSRVSSVSFRF